MTDAPPHNCRVDSLSRGEFHRRLAGAGIGVTIGPFNVRIQARVSDLDRPLYDLYCDYPLLPEESVFSFHIVLQESRTFRPWFRRLVRFSVDGRAPHEDMPIAHALPVLEWGLNLVIALRSHCFLMLHAAVLERNGRSILLPAAPGYGKTTLCAAMAHRGWRLLSDEFGLVRPDTCDLIAIPRPMALKNESIEIFRAFAPDAYIGPEVSGTRKGRVAHVKVPADCVRRQSISAPAAMIVFPRWVEKAETVIEKIGKAEGFMLLATNAFNYELLGESGFRTVGELVDGADCYTLVYSDLADATSLLIDLADRDEG